MLRPRSWLVRSIRPVVATLVAGSALAMAAPAAGRSRDFQALGLQPPKEEVEAPDFALSDPDGKTVRLRDFRGKVIFLNFFATWCGPCRLEMPAMERLSRAYRDKGLVVLAVDVRESARAVRAYTRELKLTFPTLLDKDGSVAYTYSVRPLPATYLVARDGKILWRAYGAREWDSRESRQYFARLLSGAKR